MEIVLQVLYASKKQKTKNKNIPINVFSKSKLQNSSRAMYKRLKKNFNKLDTLIFVL